MQPIAAWIDLLGSDNIEIRIRAARHLVRRDDVPLDVLVVILDELSDRGLGAGVRRTLLGRTDPELFDRMVGCLSSDATFVRETACDVLGAIGRRRAVPLVLDLLDDPNPRVRRAAVAALGRLGHEAAVRPLRNRLVDVGTDINMEMALRTALRQLGEMDRLPPPSWSVSRHSD